MVPPRRSQPFWRSVIAPASLGLLWPSVLCGFWFFFISEFGNPLSAAAVALPQEHVSAPTEVIHEARSPVDGNSHAFLEVAGRVVVDAELTHLGRVQVQADTDLLAFDLIPTGTETAALGQVQIYDQQTGRQVASFAGYGPSWTAAGQLAFRSAQGQTMSYDLETGVFAVVDENIAAASESPVTVAPDPAAAPFNPTTIRVRHRDHNHCRPGTPVDHIDVIPIEEYVARVLPAEVPPSWHMETLKAQAIAARTYAINHIYHNQNDRYPYDVSDWANTQMMCDYRHARTDQAAAETAGMILSPQGNAERLPINAMYSAENGHPTRKHGYLEYLDSVPDVNALGQERRGHGWGLSQLGAQRLAKQGLDFCQILGHYYQQVHLNNLTATSTPIGCLAINDQSGFATGRGLYIRAIAPTGQDDLTVSITRVADDSGLRWTALQPEAAAPPASGEAAVAFPPVQAQTAETTALNPESDTTEPAAVPAPEEGLPAEGNALPVAPTTDPPVPAWPITMAIPDRELLWYFPSDVDSGTVLEIALQSGAHSLHTVRVQVDHVGPQRLDFALLESNVPDIPQLSAAAAPGDRVSVGRDWRWEQSALYYSKNSGELVQDPNASDGMLWLGDPERHQMGSWYGPYTSVLPGGQSYRAIFRAGIGTNIHGEAGAVDAALPVARLDVAVERGVKILGLQDLYLTDFASEARLLNFPVDFHLFDNVEDLEFRVTWYGHYPFVLDHVAVVTLPFADWARHPLPLPLVPDVPVRDLRIVAFDAADNMSTLFSLHLGSAVRDQTTGTGFDADDCSWLGDCRDAAITLDLPPAAE